MNTVSFNTAEIDLANQIKDHVFMKDTKHRYLFANKSFLEFCNFTLKELQGKTDKDIFTKNKADFYAERDDYVLSNNETVTYRTWYQYNNGDRVYFETNKSPLVNNDGEVIGVLGVSRDVTNLVLGETKYKILFAKLENLIKHINAGILVENAKRQIVVVNDKFLQIFNIPVKIRDIVGTDCSNAADQVKHLVKDPEEFVMRIEELLYHQKVVTNDLVELHNGTFFDRDYIPVFYENEFRGQMWIYHDITNETNYKAEREDLIEQLQESNQRIARDAQQLLILNDALVNSKEILMKLTTDLDDITGI